MTATRPLPGRSFGTRRTETGRRNLVGRKLIIRAIPVGECPRLLLLSPGSVRSWRRCSSLRAGTPFRSRGTLETASSARSRCACGSPSPCASAIAISRNATKLHEFDTGPQVAAVHAIVHDPLGANDPLPRSLCRHHPEPADGTLSGSWIRAGSNGAPAHWDGSRQGAHARRG